MKDYQGTPEESLVYPPHPNLAEPTAKSLTKEPLY